MQLNNSPFIKYRNFNDYIPGKCKNIIYFWHSFILKKIAIDYKTAAQTARNQPVSSLF